MWLMCNDNNQRKRDRGFERAGEWDMIGVRGKGHGKQRGENKMGKMMYLYLN